MNLVEMDGVRSAELSPAEVNTILTRFGNHEAKLATAAIILAHPERSFSPSDLHDKVKTSSGVHEDWPELNTLTTYCRSDLEPSGVIVNEGEDTKQPAWRATRFGIKAIPWVYQLASWSLDYPDTLLQELLGTSESPMTAHAATVRRSIYQVLLRQLERDAGPLSYVEIAQSIDPQAGVTKDLVWKIGRTLADAGILYNSRLGAGRRTAITLSDRYSRPIQDFEERLGAASLNGKDSTYFTKLRELTDTPDLVARLLEKKRQWSVTRFALIDGQEGLDIRVRVAVGVLGSASVKNVRSMVENQGRKVTAEAVREALVRLVKEGIMTATENNDKTDEQRTNAHIYSLAPRQEEQDA